MSSGPKNVTSTTNSEPPAYLAGPLGAAATAAMRNFSKQFGGDSVGSQLVPRSQELVASTLSGDFLNPSSNPYLEQTFNRAADLTRTRLDTEFAGSGRNLGAALPARSEQLQTLVSNIYGGNYQAERDRQTNALVMAQDLDPINQLINRLAGITPGAGGTTTSTQPVFRTGLF